MSPATQHVHLTGGTGFVGSHLINRLVRGKTDRTIELITVLTRDVGAAVNHFQKCFGDMPVGQRPHCGADPQAAVDSSDLAILCVSSYSQLAGVPTPGAVVNLAGAGIADKRWSEERKQILKQSRIETTEKLVGWLGRLDVKPKVLISASAIGFYGAQGDKPVTDGTRPEQEFTHELCRDWEQAALKASDFGIRVFLPRISPVLGCDTSGELAGFLKRLVPPFKFGLGGPIGSGNHWMPWIHVDDLCRLMLTAIGDDRYEGPMIASAPEPVRNRTFAKTLGAVLNRPALIPLPAIVLKLAFGEMSQLLLTGQQAFPDAVKSRGFEFAYAKLESGLRAVLG